MKTKGLLLLLLLFSSLNVFAARQEIGNVVSAKQDGSAVVMTTSSCARSREPT